MDAPGVGSGKDAKDTVLAPKGLAVFPLPSEKEGNMLEQYTTDSQPKSNLGGKTKF